MQGDPAHHLHVEMAHPHHPGRGFADYRKGFGQQFIQGFAIFKGLPESGCLVLQVAIGKLPHRICVAINGVDQLCHSLDFTIILGADDFFYDGTQHKTSGSVKVRTNSPMAARLFPRKVSHSKHNRIER